MSNNLNIWDAVRTPDPAFTKSFSRTGGFKGTATNVVYLIRRATELWGPMGDAWGIDVVDEKIIDGAPLLDAAGAVIGHEKLHTIRISLRHPTGAVPGIGQTMLVGKNKYGPFTDEEAPKKSLTDALTKAMSWLGFAADIHMGLFDDSKYVNDARQQFEGKPLPAGQEPAEQPAPIKTLDDIAAAIDAAIAAGKVADVMPRFLGYEKSKKDAVWPLLSAESHAAIKAAWPQKEAA